MPEAITNALDFISEAELSIVRVSIMLCDLIGVVVLMTTVFKSVYSYFHRDRHVKLMLAKGIALALEFKLAGEILRTVTARDWNELVILGTIILLRGAITLLIHWEIKAEKTEQREENGTSIHMTEKSDQEDGGSSAP